MDELEGIALKNAFNKRHPVGSRFKLEEKIITTTTVAWRLPSGQIVVQYKSALSPTAVVNIDALQES